MREAHRPAGGQAEYMSRRLKPLPSALELPVFTAEEARAAGVSTQRLRGSDISRLGRGIYNREDYQLTERAIVEAYCRSDPAVVARGLTAARAWGLPLPLTDVRWEVEGARSPVRLNSTASRRRSGTLVRWSSLALSREETATSHGMLLTSRVRTWMDLAPHLSLDDLIRIGDHLVRHPRFRYEHRHAPYATPAQLEQLLREYRGRGARRLRGALGEVRVGADSPAETTLRLEILRAGLPAPELNVFLHAGSASLGQPDLSWPEWKVCVEHEGPSHLDRDQQDQDIQRGERRRHEGWIEVQTTAKDLHDNCARGLRRITEALRRQGWLG